MPLIETKGAASAQGFGLTLGAVESGPFYIENVFSTWLYTGNGSTQTITNGINLSGKGGLVWIKGRSGATDHALYDTTRGATKDLVSNSVTAETTQSTGLTAFNGTGFSIGALAKLNTNAATYVSWTFRKQPKFFDVVTWTGNSVAGRQIPHSLGSVPGCIIVKSTNSADPWWVYHRSTGNTGVMILNTTSAFTSPLPNAWNNTDPTATVFTVGSAGQVNQTGQTYVAYLFAHNAGGFGLSGTDNVISCGSWTGNGSTSGPTVTLGYEPQYILWKQTNTTSDWFIIDSMRGSGMTGSPQPILYPNLSSAELGTSGTGVFDFSATGFQIRSTTGGVNASGGTYIYIAIRRGPMKVPTSGTSVYSPQTYYGNATSRQITFGFPVDMVFGGVKDDGGNFKDYVFDRLRGANYFLKTNDGGTAAESNTPANIMTSFASNTQITVGTASDWNPNTFSVVLWGLQRAPSFFDVVCYTGTGSATTFNHNLGVAPELVIVKWRSGATGENWAVMCTAASSSPDRRFLYLDLNAAGGGLNGIFADSSGTPVLPTATQVYIGTNPVVNKSSATYVAYLFATCAGVSKVGTYTGTGALQTVNCGFTGGARFVLIKRTDSTGDWYVYDSARGISSSGNDPYLLLNSTAAEVTGTNYVGTTSVGFQVTAAAPAGLNANGGTYIFLAIA